MQRSETIDALAAALAKAQGAMKNPTFDSLNPHFKAKYASLAAVRDAVIPQLALQEIAVTQLITSDEDGVQCETVLWHASGQWISTTLHLPATQTTAQGYAAAATYAKRIALQALVCVAGDEDDDGESALPTTRQEKHTNKQQQRRKEPETHEAAEACQTLREHIDLLMAEQGVNPQAIEAYWLQQEARFGTPIPYKRLFQLADQMEKRARERDRAAHDAAGKPHSPPRRDSMAWDLLTAHQDDAMLPEAILERIHTTLSDEDAPESAAQALANEVMDLLNDTMPATMDRRKA